MLKKLKPRNMLILMIAILAIQTLYNLPRGIISVVLSTTYLGFAVLTLLGLKKNEKSKLAVKYLMFMLILNIIVWVIGFIYIWISSESVECGILANIIITITELICIRMIIINGDYTYNKLLATALVSKAFLVTNLAMLFIRGSRLIEIIALLVVAMYFYEYEKNYNGLFDEKIYEKELARPKIKIKTFKDFCANWILYILVVESAFICNYNGALGLISLIFWILITLLNPKLMKKTQEKYKQMSEEQRIINEKNAKQQEFDDNSKSIYNYYLKNKYSIEDEETNTVVAGTRNITVEELIELYDHGKALTLKAIEEEQARKIEEAKAKAEESYQEFKQAAALYGKNKYLSVLDEKISSYEAMKNLASAMSDSYRSGARQAMNTRKSDPYILGGMANGIAGPAAGIMVASQIDRENREREAKGKEIAEASMERASEWREKSYTYDADISMLKRIRNKINEALIITDIEKVKDNIKVKSKKCKLKSDVNFCAEITIEAKAPKILDKSAVIDGSFKVKILDEENNLVAEGYSSARNITIWDSGKLYDKGNVRVSTAYGFYSGGEFEVDCKILDYSKVDKDKKYKAEVEFINLWIMEDIN